MHEGRVMAGTEFKFEGGKELEAALLELKTAAAKRVSRKVLKEAAEPIASVAVANAPVREGDLKSNINVSPRLTKRQARQNKASKSDVEMHVGTPDRAGRLQEFGTVNHPPQPFMRPAWDKEGGEQALGRIRDGLTVEVTKAAQRAARKAAKFAKTGK